jgi:hypothetical protein
MDGPDPDHRRNLHDWDIDAIMDDMTEDCVFEHVAPPATSFGRGGKIAEQLSYGTL